MILLASESRQQNFKSIFRFIAYCKYNAHHEKARSETQNKIQLLTLLILICTVYFNVR